MVRVEWYGHSFVVLEYRGVRIAIDPHDGASLNLPTYKVKADYVLVTHNHYDHNAVEVISGIKDIVKWRLGKTVLEDIEVYGIPSYHDKSGGELRGPNTVFKIQLGDLTIVHAGDLGHLPNRELLDHLIGVDLLILPVGGVYTIDAYEAWDIVKNTAPRLVLPVHYWLPQSTLPLDPLDVFLRVAKTRRLRLDGNILEVTREDLPEKTTVIVPRIET